MSETVTAAPRRPGAGATLAIDYGPLVVFFLTNFFAPVPHLLRIFFATGAFMVAMLVAMAFSYLRYRRISPMLWFSGFIVLVLGGLTIWLHQEWFIKIKPTLYYLVIAALLGFGLYTGRNLLKTLLGGSYPGLSDQGWRLLTRNWIGYFLFAAVLNEAIWRTTSTDFWAASKLWLFVPMTFLFGAANLPMLMRHGLTLEEPVKDAAPPPVE